MIVCMFRFSINGIVCRRWKYLQTATVSLSSYNKVRSYDVEKTPITAQLWKLRQEARENNTLIDTNDTSPILPLSADINYQFSEDASLRDLYVDLKGQILLGKLFEDFDSIAGNIAFSHCFKKSNQNILSLVTAAVDYIRISKNKTLSTSINYVLSGKVIWVGRSSLEVLVELHEEKSNDKVLSSVFTYVARDKSTQKSYEIINKLNPQTMEEKQNFESRESIKQQKKQMKLKKTTSLDENGQCSINDQNTEYDPCLLQQKDIVKQLIKGNRLLDMPTLSSEKWVLMSSTRLENSFITQPQNVNTAGKVFGGLLIHRAYDLALATSFTFIGKYPIFQEIAEISFKYPVEVGDLVKLKSRVVYSHNLPSESQLQVQVTCQIIKLDQLCSVVSNTFDFVFSIPRVHHSDELLKEIAPSTLEEALVYLVAESQLLRK